MAAAVAQEPALDQHRPTQSSLNGHEDPFASNSSTPGHQSHVHRYSSRFDLNSASPGATSSPSQVKRILEAHLIETERRLEETQKLGTTLLDQQARLQDKLRDVEQQQDEAEITPRLKQQLATIAQEHDETGKDLARKLLMPKTRAASGEGDSGPESGTYTSHATGSPTKISAPNRRSRNMPTSRVGDLQFAADISTSLLAQVRQLQAAVAERDEVIKNANTGRLQLEQDVQGFSQRLRDLQEHEQRYKDENWNLETQNHELLTTTREAADKERRLNASLAAALAEKSRLQGDFEEARLAHGQLSDEHTAAKKAHETEMHSLKRNVDAVDVERSTLQSKVEELTAQNQELARAMAGKFRNISPNIMPDMETDGNDMEKDLETPEHSPPPSPTKATPRHGGLESETLRSSLHHAHRMIQNLKGNIHREKTEKIELKRMLQDARDELEQRRSDGGLGSGAKKPKTRTETFKKPLRPDQLGGSRRARTDVEMDEEDWEDHAVDSPSAISRQATVKQHVPGSFTDASDAEQTANETESAFETADERNVTESEAFETGAESLAGDSTDDLTETEDTVPGAQRTTVRAPRNSLALKQAGNRSSYLSTASTSADDDEELQTPAQSQPHKFRLRNGRSSYARHSSIPYEGTPGSARSSTTARDSPATVTDGRSPAVPEQSLFAELGGLDDTNSDRFSTPARSSEIADDSTPHHLETPSRAPVVSASSPPFTKPTMVDSAMMTEPWQPEHLAQPDTVATTTAMASGTLAANNVGSALQPRAPSPSDFPLPPSVPTSPLGRNDMSTQYTPQRTLLDSPVRNTNFITPPKTIWDEASEADSPMRDFSTNPRPRTPVAPLAYSGMLAQTTSPKSPAELAVPQPKPLAYSSILSQQTRPVAPDYTRTEVLPPIPSAGTTDQTRKPRNTENVVAGAAAGGLLATAATAAGLQYKDRQTPVVMEGKTSTPNEALVDPQQKMSKDISGSFTGLPQQPLQHAVHSQAASTSYSRHDQGAQTLLTADQIEQAMRPRAAPPLASAVIPGSAQQPSVVRAVTPTTSRFHEALEGVPHSQVKPQNTVDTSLTALPAVPGPSSRSASANSHRSSSVIAQQHPPLPPDYRTNIAKANGTTSVPTPEKKTVGTGIATIMGPPLMPASAMRRPRTPAESMRSPTRDNATPRASHSRGQQRGTTSSQLSRRSSVSSFASELDERFNIHPNGVPNNVPTYEAGPGTDPRMIQAITQTMIGEYLWKYTRNTFNKDFSNSRHRRYFWVHPYTKTLYWSSTGPEAGEKEQTSRSVVIESVRVVTDDNPMPPGLHRKSLEVTTPGRKIRFTASTGQRHETWFNALSYLLLRTDAKTQNGTYSAGGNDITTDDINEFNVGGYNAHLVPRTSSRLSMSSYNSRTTRGTSTHRASRQAMPSNVISNTIVQHAAQPSNMRGSSMPPNDNNTMRTSRAEQSRDPDHDRTIRGKSMSRISKMFGSVSGRPSTGTATTRPESSQQTGYQQSHNRPGSSNSIYDASVVSASRRDSAEEMRQEMLRQEAVGLGHKTGNGAGLENVRACCDGKHDVSTLTHDVSTLTHPQHRQGDKQRPESSVSDRINRSVSRRM